MLMLSDNFTSPRGDTLSDPDNQFLSYAQVLEILANPPEPPYKTGSWVIIPSGETGIITGANYFVLADEPAWEFFVVYLVESAGEEEAVWDDNGYSADLLKPATSEQIEEALRNWVSVESPGVAIESIETTGERP